MQVILAQYLEIFKSIHEADHWSHAKTCGVLGERMPELEMRRIQERLKGLFDARVSPRVPDESDNTKTIKMITITSRITWIDHLPS
jgi:hypothetical protein